MGTMSKTHRGVQDTVGFTVKRRRMTDDEILDSLVQKTTRGAEGALSSRFSGSGHSIRSAMCEKCDKHTPHKAGFCIYCNLAIKVRPVQSRPGVVTPPRTRRFIRKKVFRAAAKQLRNDKRSASHAAADASRLKFEGK